MVFDMDIKLKQDFILAWKRFFGEAELPITFYYTDEEERAELVKPGSGQRRVFVDLSRVRKATSCVLMLSQLLVLVDEGS
jgi:hypothetical protein